jgi:glyoxylase-like metal-dependent hydrolase (beta-lactamase superfamily II)
MDLPAPKNEQAYWTVSALEGGIFHAPTSFVVKGRPLDEIETTPSLAFLLVHSQTGHKFMFDLGTRKDWHNLPPAAIAPVKANPGVLTVDSDILDALSKANTPTSHIDTICVSHTHFDHVGDPSHFTRATFVVGPGTESLLEDGYPDNPSSILASDLFPAERTKFLSFDNGTSIGPFRHSIDYFKDGSLYIIDAPGHIAGHVNLLARTSPDGGWIYLAGDSAHHWDLITGKGKIAVGHPAISPDYCAHVDKHVAEENIGRIRKLYEKEKRVRILLAHDAPWYQENRGGPCFWPGSIPSL